jgi:hypothetical protein
VTPERTAAFLACVAAAVVAGPDANITLWLADEDEARELAPMIATLIGGKVDRRVQPSGPAYYFNDYVNGTWPKAHVVLYVRAGLSKAEVAA